MMPRSSVRHRLRPLLILGLAILGAVLPARSAQDWVDQRQAGTFVCRAEFSLEDYGSLLGELHQLPKDLEELLQIKVSDQETEVLLFRDRYAYQRYLQLRVPEGMQRAALFVKGEEEGRIYAFRSRDLAANLRHEGTHAVLHGCLQVLPLWLDEGLAEYFEAPAANRLNGHPHEKSIKLMLRVGLRPSLKRIEELRDMADMGSRDYRDSWAWVHFLLHGPPEGKAVLVKYLQDVQNGVPPGILRENLLRAMPDAEDRLAEHFRNGVR